MSNRYYKNLLLLASMILFAVSTYAQEAYGGKVNYKNASVEMKPGGKDHKGIVDVKLTADFGQINLKSSQMVQLTPFLVSKDGVYKIPVDSFYVAGCNRYKSVKRQVALNQVEPYASMFAAGKVASLKEYKSGKRSAVVFNRQYDYQPWMRDAKLIVEEKVTGCANCDVEQNALNILDAHLKPLQPSFHLVLIVPQIEKVKRRSESMEAYINYKQGRAEILKDFKNNQSELDNISAFMKKLQTDKNLKISDFMLAGYASPEGNFNSNMKLSQRRAEALASYMKRNYDLSGKNLNVKWYGEDWNGLSNLVSGSNLGNKGEILAIIEKNNTDVRREAEIRKLDNGVTYNLLLNEYYPKLRRNTLTASFVVKEFTTDEALEVYRKNPVLLSQEELYRVANTFEKGSDEYIKAMRVAMELFPKDRIAKINYAISQIQLNNPTHALEVISAADQNNADVLNVKGVALAKTGKLKEAEACFIQSARMGNQEAQKNLEELKRVM
ncbi:DUF3868 domain-containing protein [Porphyromonas pogonae]|uniref:DUF3868 domain-containing protein n=1 Tax=Porphyromonas pogonae TaxID=867595 RepID=UPI002E76964B|nr:DUF3868 domain-containing protein [Porphyromonas pogonae]